MSGVAHVSGVGPRYLFLGWSAELSYIHTHVLTDLVMGEELGN